MTMTNIKLAAILRRNQMSMTHDLKWAALMTAGVLMTLASVLG